MKHVKLFWICFSFVFLINAKGQSPIAEGKTKFLGGIHSTSQIEDFEKYWNQVTPENAGKWGSVESARDVYNWTQLDQAYEFAHNNNFPFRYHVLLWGNQQPSWIEGLSAEEQLEEIIEWMDTVAARYPDIDYLEVINEPLNDPPYGTGNGNYLNALGGTGVTGFDWMITGFRMARERFPNAKLMVNEYNILNSPGRATTYINAISELQQEGLIDIIGVQAHAFTTTANNEVMKSVLDMLEDTGLPVMVTELDIDGLSDSKQLEDYQRIFPLLWEHQAVMGITLWGFRPGLWRNAEQAYLIDTDGTERSALKWLREYVETTDLTLGLLADFKTSSILIYPNPVSDYLFINESWNIKKARIIDLTGNEVWVNEQIMTEKVYLGDLPKGYYIFTEVRKDGSLVTSKLKIQ